MSNVGFALEELGGLYKLTLAYFYHCAKAYQQLKWQKTFWDKLIPKKSTFFVVVVTSQL